MSAIGCQLIARLNGLINSLRACRQTVFLPPLPAIMQAPDWNDYQTFLAIAHQGQIGRAARYMGVDATTIGRRLRRLEARLGQTLFEQTREGQILTEAGEALFAHVEAMSIAAGHIAVPARSREGPAGTLRISVSEGFGTWFLASRLQEFSARYPNVTVDLVASSNYLNLSRREADVAVFLSRPQAGPLVATKLAPYKLGLYAGRSYLARFATPRSVTELSTHHLVGYIPDLLTAPELRYAEEIHPECRVALRSTSINAQFAMLASGGGIGILPCFIGDSSSKLRRVLSEVELTRSLWLVTHKDTQQLARVTAFGSWLRELLEGGGANKLLGRR